MATRLHHFTVETATSNRMFYFHIFFLHFLSAEFCSEFFLSLPTAIFKNVTPSLISISCLPTIHMHLNVSITWFGVKWLRKGSYQFLKTLFCCSLVKSTSTFFNVLHLIVCFENVYLLTDKMCPDISVNFQKIWFLLSIKMLW